MNAVFSVSYLVERKMRRKFVLVLVSSIIVKKSWSLKYAMGTYTFFIVDDVDVDLDGCIQY